ncbi:unnamed protein product [Urochloa decumbens]|uniref:Rx N-terminal domain-containing protein n=1 Tax=Urochloa decumbens TaxID=240449 RepID=A0ABC9G5E6_9POAL
MAGIVGSAVATEAVSRISSILSGDKPSHESIEDKAERLEMAVLKIRSVVAVSEDHHISHPPLLLWKAKLKRVAEEGDDLLHTLLHKKRALERHDDAPATAAKGNSISQQLIQAARRLVPFRRREEAGELDGNTVRRFERLADGADSFFRLVESGGRPRNPIFLPSLARPLLAGDSMEFSIRGIGGGGDELIVLWPWLDNPGVGNGNGVVACLAVSHEDELMWEKSLKMSVVFRLSEASDILGIAMGCLELLPPQFGAAGVAIRRLLAETIGRRSGDRSNNLSERSMWCRRHIESHSRHDREPSVGDNDIVDKQKRGTGIFLPDHVLQLTASCYVSPSTSCQSSCPMKDGLPLELVYHVSPHFLPEKHSDSNQFELVEQDDVGKLLPRVTRYHGRGQGVTCERQIWCPKSSMFCTVGPVISMPLTVAQACQMETYGAPSRRRGVRRTNKCSRKSNHL